MKARTRDGLTAVEVLASSLLASMLMVALLGVMRGLKTQEAALESRVPTENWRHTLDQVLDFDLANSRSYQLTPTKLILRGFAGRDAQSGIANWTPSTITYTVVEHEGQPWLVRHDLSSADTQELVLRGVTSIWAGVFTDNGGETRVQSETPIADGLQIEFLGSDAKQPIYAYQFRR